MTSIYTDYATPEDVAEYMGIEVASLPSDIDLLITKASRMVNMQIYMVYDSSKDSHVEAAKLATCDQVQYWTIVGVNTATESEAYESVKIGSLSIKNANSGGSSPAGKVLTLQNSARMYLERVGLLFRGVKLR